MWDRRALLRLQRDTGFDPNMLEKGYHLTRVLSLLEQNREVCERLTLKGGTALNFLYLNLPRLSIDLDFNYTGALSRQTMLAEKQSVLDGIKATLSPDYRIRAPKGSYIMERVFAHYTNLFGRPDRVKIEVNFLERLPLAERLKQTCVPIFPQFPSVQVWTYTLEELLSMKFKTLLERSYPRDLWDVSKVIEQELSLEQFQKLLVVYVCFIPRGVSFLSELTARIQRFDTEEVSRDLRQLIRHEPQSGVLGGEGLEVREMIDQITRFVEQRKLRESEVEFLTAFSEGRIQAELLFDAEHAAKVNQHPSLLWAVGRQGN